MQSDPAPPALCGITRRTGRFTWVCVNPVHDDEGQKNVSPNAGGRYYPKRERHWFVRLYPRSVEDELDLPE